MNKTIQVILLLFLGSFLAAAVFIFKNSDIFNTTYVFEKEDNYQKTSFSLVNAPEESLKGEIVRTDGVVLRQSRTATVAAQLENKTAVQQGEIFKTDDDGEIDILFKETASVSIFKNSEVEIVQTLPVNLVFQQIGGEVSYEVLGKSPLSIRCLNMLVNLPEGLIAIDLDKETGELTLALKNGNATIVYNSADFESQVWELEPEDIFVYDSNKREGFLK